ncbi:MULTISPECIES: hypothetical protein [unclassified Corallococcus]|uniref:hypothetical protein n=1 Tax=unclassified Corallococcus TaxID=2685029 RepID=UPI001A8DB09E|nr:MULTISPECIES: hypothetical protein [unclassified Corallococcus]MBN9687372.1 hypothetical protein [Corallococcus sp. NCSPR001]WAS88806.1 hypothetical protein O0N60_17885 [Corallococcus sp. NCRR]
MTLSDYLALPDLHSLSVDEVEALNKELSKAELKDIPPEKRSQVIDYLDAALLCSAEGLNIRAVALDIQSDLSRLFEELKAAS